MSKVEKLEKLEKLKKGCHWYHLFNPCDCIPKEGKWQGPTVKYRPISAPDKDDEDEVAKPKVPLHGPKILAYLDDGQERVVADIAAAIGTDFDAVRAAIKRLVPHEVTARIGVASWAKYPGPQTIYQRATETTKQLQPVDNMVRVVDALKANGGEMRVTELAKLLDLPPTQVSSALFRARRRLRARPQLVAVRVEGPLVSFWRAL